MVHAYLVSNRRLEWFIALYTATWGIGLLLPFETLSTSPAYDVLLIWAPEVIWGQVSLVIGALHCASLWINGMATWTPFTRALAAWLNAIVFLTMAVGCFLAIEAAAAVMMHIMTAMGAGFVFCSAVRDCIRVWVKWTRAVGENEYDGD